VTLDVLCIVYGVSWGTNHIILFCFYWALFHSCLDFESFVCALVSNSELSILLDPLHHQWLSLAAAAFCTRWLSGCMQSRVNLVLTHVINLMLKWSTCISVFSSGRRWEASFTFWPPSPVGKEPFIHNPSEKLPSSRLWLIPSVSFPTCHLWSLSYLGWCLYISMT
jgi:hypothetical protein